MGWLRSVDVEREGAVGIDMMGKVVVSIKVENINDSLEASAGRLSLDEVRSIEVDDAVVDTEVLDFVVDPVGRRLVGNPENHRQNILDLF